MSPAPVRHVLRRPEDVLPLVSRLALSCERPDRVAIGLAELLMNAIEHGSLGLGFDAKRRLLGDQTLRQEIARRLALPPWQARTVSVDVDTYADLVRFTVRDEGAGFDWRGWTGPAQMGGTGPNGRGIAIARELCFASVIYRGCGNVVEAITPRDRGHPRPGSG